MIHKRLLTLTNNHRLTLLITILFGFLSGILIVLQASTLSGIIKRVFLDGAELSVVLPQMIWLLTFILLRTLTTFVSDMSANYSARQIKNDLRQQLLDQIIQIGPGYVRGERTGELVNTLVTGIEALDIYFREYLPQLAVAALVPLTILCFVFPIDWITGVILLVTAPLIPIFMFLIGNAAESLTQRQWKTLSRMSAFFFDILQGLTTLKVLGQSRAQIKIIAQISDRYRHNTMQVLRVAFLSALALEWLSTLSTAVIAVSIGLRLLYGQLDFQQAFFMLILAPDFYLPLRLLGTRFHAGIAGVSAAERIFAILDIPSSKQPVQNFGRTSAQTKTPPEIRLVDISYTYPGENHPVINKVSLHIPSQSRVAIAGPSGAGKSTLAAILLGLLTPDEGQILVNGIGTSLTDDPSWRKKTAWVPQHPYLFNDTAAANIRLASQSADNDTVKNAAIYANANEFIAHLPEGYQTILGERAIRLSVGQAQRIALARAFLRKDGSFLVLDEATANLDPKLEHEIQASIENLMENSTVFMIAHRLPTIMNADHIFVLSAGQIIQSGTHHELIQQEGLYRELVSAYSDGHNNKSTSESQQQNKQVQQQRTTEQSVSSIAPTAEDHQAAKQNTLRLLFSLIKPYLGWVALSVILGFATVGSGIGLMSVSAYIISTAALQPSIAVLQIPIVGVRFFGLSRGLFRYLERLVTHQTTFRILKNLRVWFYTSLEPLAPARLLQYRSGDLLTRILADINSLENFFVRVLAPPIVAILVGAVMVIFMAYFSKWLGLTLLIFLVIAGIIFPAIMQILSKTPGKELITYRADLNGLIVDGLQGLQELLVYGQINYFQQKFLQASQLYSSAHFRIMRLSAFQNSGLLFLSHFCMWIILLLSIPMVRAEQFDGIVLSVIVFAVLSTFEAIQPLPQAASTLEECIHAANRLIEIVQSKPDVEDPMQVRPIENRFNLEIKDLTFHYPGSSSNALSNINIQIPEGTKTAIVGPSGAGKSTIASLLLRFWDVPDGSIYIGNKDIRQLSQNELRQKFAVVSQSTYLFNASVRENLLLAHPSASDDEILLACRQAQIESLVLSLPSGLDTILGEQGFRLSAGERQRIAIARAILKNAPILILDEATANLDSITERRVLLSLQALMKNRTSLVITHRLIGLENMDQILVLQGGKIIERGKHINLASSGGVFQEMLHHQNKIIQFTLNI